MLRQFQRLRNEEGNRMEELKREQQRRKLQYRDELVGQIEEKKQQVSESREEYVEDRRLVEQLVSQVIEEEQE
jgi:hypothetical protein